MLKLLGNRQFELTFEAFVDLVSSTYCNAASPMDSGDWMGMVADLGDAAFTPGPIVNHFVRGR